MSKHCLHVFHIGLPLEVYGKYTAGDKPSYAGLNPPTQSEFEILSVDLIVGGQKYPAQEFIDNLSNCYHAIRKPKGWFFERINADAEISELCIKEIEGDYA